MRDATAGVAVVRKTHRGSLPRAATAA